MLKEMAKKRKIAATAQHVSCMFENVFSSIQSYLIPYLDVRDGLVLLTCNHFIQRIFSKLVMFKKHHWQPCATLQTFGSQNLSMLKRMCIAEDKDTETSCNLHMMPTSIHFMHIGSIMLTQHMVHFFTDSLVSIKFPNSFDCSLWPGWLPPYLKKLAFGERFNRPINKPGLLPDGLLKLTFGARFNQALSMLPVGLQTLTLGKEYTRFISDLPISLSKLTLYGAYYCGYDQLPYHLKTFHIYSNMVCLRPATFPKSLCKVKWLPASFKNAVFMQCSENEISIIDASQNTQPSDNMGLNFGTIKAISPEGVFDLRDLDNFMQQVAPHLKFAQPFCYRN